jgi:hypothetical protein
LLAVQTRTRNALWLAGFAAVAALGLIAVWRVRQRPDLRQRALDAVPNGALLVATADLAALRASAVGGRFLKEGREIPGLGKVRDVCGFDPLDVLTEVAIAIPAAGDPGDFGLVGAGPVEDQALLACAAKVIEARGGRAVLTRVGSFQTVRDADLATPGGEIAVRPGGPLLLGGGAYLRAMIDTADGRGPSVRSSAAHGQLGGAVGEGAVRATVVLTPEQRRTLVEELRATGGDAAAASVVAGAIALQLGASVRLHAVLACEEARACAGLAEALRAARTERAADMGTRMIGLGSVLDRLDIEAERDLIHARVEVPTDEAALLLDRVLNLRGFRHPMPRPAPEDTGSAPAGPLPAPDEVLRPDGG